MVKRGAVSEAALDVKKKKQKLADELASVQKQQDDQEHDKVLNHLLTVAIGNTSLIKKLLSHAEVIQQGSVVDAAHFPKTYIYVSEIPRDFNLTQVIPALTGKISKQQLVTCCKIDNRADLKLAYLGAGMGPDQKILDHEKKKYLEIVVARTKALNNPMDRVKFNGDGSINWDARGYWELLPARRQGTEPGDHKYTEVRCRVLASDNNRALPAAFRITGDWTLKEAWRLTTKLESPADVKPQVRLKVSDLFANNSTFKELVEELPVYGKRHVKAKAAARPKKGEPEPEMTEEEKKKARLTKALGRLKRANSKQS